MTQEEIDAVAAALKVQMAADVVKVEAAAKAVPSIMAKVGTWVIGMFKTIGPAFDHRTLWLVVPILIALFFVDAAWIKTLLQFAGSAVVLVGFAHLIRKLLMPDFDLSLCLERAQASAVGSAIVASAVIVLFCVLLLFLSGAMK